MQRRVVSKPTDSSGGNLNKFVTGSKPRDGPASSPLPAVSPGVLDETSRLMQRMEDRNLKNGYAFQIRFADRERTVFFAKQEVEALAQDIGIDIERDKANHIWFLQQALLSELPHGWTKELDLRGNTVYHNFLNNSSSKNHPNAIRFRIAFNDLLKYSAVKQSIATEATSSISRAEKAYLRAKLERLPKSELDGLLRRMRSEITREEERTTETLTKQTIKCIFGG